MNRLVEEALALIVSKDTSARGTSTAGAYLAAVEGHL
jgi:hypothetical protein